MRQNYSDDIQKQYYKITDDRGETILVINSILFKGKRRINWDDVEEYLKNYVGKSYEIKDAQKGWYRYMTRFALPVFLDTGEICRYNCFRIEVLVRHSNDGKKYLYDLVNIKKETSTPLES